MNQTARELYPLSKKKVLKKSLSTIFTSLLILISLATLIPLDALNTTFVSLVSENARSTILVVLIILGIVVLVMVVLEVLYQYWYFKTYYYDLKEDVIVIRKNPITPMEISIPYGKVNDVYVDQDFFDRILKIYDLHISSATEKSGTVAHIDGLEETSVKELRTLILSKMKEYSLEKKNQSI